MARTDPEPSSEDATILQSLMNAVCAERVEFMGWRSTF
jgi:hypothetical protein